MSPASPSTSCPLRLGGCARGSPTWRASRISAALSLRRLVRLLALIALDPLQQGRGIGGGLLAAGFARTDALGLPSYLMTESERNVRFYERHGFAVADASPLGAGGPTIWTMGREVGAAPVRRG